MLTIGIPTFNRENELKVALNDLAIQLEKIDGRQIELLVSDNNSTDNTKYIVKNFAEAHKSINFKYIRASENLGFDRNCNEVIKNALGQFVWLLSDDDKLHMGAVFDVFQTLNTNKDVSFVFVNYQISTDGIKVPSRCAVKETKRLSGDKFMIESGLAFSLVSSCILNKIFWCEEDFERYYGSNWINLFLCRDIVAGRDAMIIGAPLLEMKGLGLLETRNEKIKSDFGTYEFYMTAHLNLVKFAWELKDYGFSDEVCHKVVNFVWASNLRQVFYYKATVKKYSWGELVYFKNKMIKYFGGHWSLWVCQLPLLFLPSFITGNIYWSLSPIYKFFKEKIL